MLNEYLGQEYPEGRALSVCHTPSSPMQQLGKSGSPGLPKSIDQEPPIQCVGTKRRRGEFRPCSDYTEKGGRMAPYNTTEVSSSTPRIGHDILQPKGGESIAETCAPTTQTSPMNVHASKPHAINMGLGSVENPNTWNSLSQHKWKGLMNEGMANVDSIANAPILGNRYSSAVPHASTQRLLRSGDCSDTTNVIKTPSNQGSSPEWHYKDLRAKDGMTSAMNKKLLQNDALNSIREMDPTIVYSTMANKEGIKAGDLSVRNKWALFLRYLSYLEWTSKRQPTLHKVDEGGKEAPVTDGGCKSKTLTHNLTTDQIIRVPADPHGHEGLQAENPSTKAIKTNRISLANGRKEASAEIVPKRSNWSDDSAIDFTMVGPEHGYAAAESFDCKKGELSQSSLSNVLDTKPDLISPGRHRYTGLEKQSAVDISNEKIYEGKGPNGTRGKKVASKLLGIPISTLYKWESDVMKNPPKNAPGLVVDQPSNATVQDSPKSSNAGAQQDSPNPPNARMQHVSPKSSKARILQGLPKQSNARELDSPKFVRTIRRINQPMRHTDEDKLAAIEMSREVTDHGTGRNGTRGKASVARQIGVSVKTMWRWEQNEHFYRTRLKQQQRDQDTTGRKLLILQKACEMVRNDLKERCL